MGKSRLKPYEKKWVNKVKNGELDGVKSYRNSSYEKNVYQDILSFEDGKTTLNKRQKVPFFDGKETNRDWYEETFEIDSDRDLVNQLKRHKYTKDIKEKVDFSEQDLYITEQAKKKHLSVEMKKEDNKVKSSTKKTEKLDNEEPTVPQNDYSYSYDYEDCTSDSEDYGDFNLELISMGLMAAFGVGLYTKNQYKKIKERRAAKARGDEVSTTKNFFKEEVVTARKSFSRFVIETIKESLDDD